MILKRILYKQLAKVLIVITLSLFFVLCKKKYDTDTAQQSASLKDVANVLGGADYLKTIKALSYTVVGTSLEYEQSGPQLPGPVTTSAYRYNYITLLNQRKVNFTYSMVNFTYPVFLNLPPYKMIINDTVGNVLGQFDWLSYYTDQNNKTALPANRIEAVLKNQRMCNPIELIKELLEKNDVNLLSNNNVFTLTTLINNVNIEITIDAKTLLPTEVKIQEEDFLQGDSKFVIQYKEWNKVSGTIYPHRIFYKLNDNIIKEEIISDVKINPLLTGSEFTIEPLPNRPNYNFKEAKIGFLASQWFNRLAARGMIYDKPMDMGAVAMENVDLSSIDVVSQKISDSVKIIGSPDVNIWAVAISTKNGVVLVEAPLNPYWTKSIIASTHHEFPNQRIIGVIPTHTHSDHLGGIREVMLEAQKIYVTAEAASSIKKFFENKHTLLLDSFTKSPVNYIIEEINGVKTIANGQMQIHQFKQSDVQGNPFVIDNSHASDMVIVYLPKEKVIIEADIFNGGTFLNILKGKTKHQFVAPVKAEFKKRATFLLNYIAEKKLNVEKVIGIHGGVASLEEVKNLVIN